ncbi:conserved Plasmodium protein, unknown function [Plasmodium relictum]|uniref:Uncharacterized protein n=1 Tax=Plasmodium relictum TaxID=85471 RepID=A0A1J1HFB5_PLARL|nr:conserved Plasmodium protein, unknown function [Plasmodium relictum]CRH02746.1 conserved Plasmodium protein, unknown function [Plasmodium relictum]
MFDVKYENLNKYDLKICQINILKKKEKRNDLKNILFFPSLFWFNGHFSYPLPFLKYNEIKGFEIKDYVACSIHKHSIIIRRILKNEILNINMFNEKKVLSCLFYIDFDYILKLLNIFVKSYYILNKNESIESSYNNIRYYLFYYNEKNEIHLFDVEKNNSILSICEKRQITCLNFNFLYINEKNSLYNKLSNDAYEGNIKIVDFDKIDEKIVLKNKYSFELLQDRFNDDLYKKNDFKILKNIFYVLIYGDEEGNVYFFVPDKKIKIKKKLSNERVKFIETNVKEYFKVKNRHDLFQTINSNYYIFIVFNDSIHIVNFYVFETYFIINFVNEKLFCLTTKFNYLWKNYLSFSTKNYVKIFNINEKKLLHNIKLNSLIEQDNDLNKNSKDDILICDRDKINDIYVSNFDEKNKNYDYNNNYDEDKNSKIGTKRYIYETKEEKSKDSNSLIEQVTNIDTNKKEKELKYYTCVYFDLKDNLYISNNKGLVYVYNLSKQQIINTFDINCKIVFYLFTFTLKNKEYIYVYDSEKFYCLFLINKKKIIYKIFTIGLWIYHILCFHNNIIFSLGNENLYNLVIESSKRNFLKSIYSNNINVCIYLINHPNLPIIAFINKKLVFGFFFLADTKNINIPSIKENQNIISICWFKRSKNIFLGRRDSVEDYLSNNEETSFTYDPIRLENQNLEILQKKRKKIIKKFVENNNDFDTHIAVLNDNTLYLYNIVNKEIKKLNNDILKNLFNFKGKKYMSSTFVNNICYIFILYEKKLIVFDECWNFSRYDIKIEEKINKMYLKEDIIFLHSNSNIYFMFVENILNHFNKANYYMDKNSDEKISNNKTSNNNKALNENNILHSYELYFIRLKLKENLKIVLFDFYYLNEEVYVAIFSKKKQIFVYKINLNDDCIKKINENKHLEIDTKLLAQFFNFYIFDHINKVGSILCMKFFYNSKKKKIYLAFGGLEQFLFLWNFSKYSVIQKK